MKTSRKKTNNRLEESWVIHHMTAPHITSHDLTWRNIHNIIPHHMTAHDMTWHIATNHNHLTSYHFTSHHITSPPPTQHENTTSHHQTPPPSGTAEGWCTHKTWFGHRTGWWPCARSVGKLFLWLIDFFPAETSAAGSPENYCYKLCIPHTHLLYCTNST